MALNGRSNELKDQPFVVVMVVELLLQITLKLWPFFSKEHVADSKYSLHLELVLASIVLQIILKLWPYLKK